MGVEDAEHGVQAGVIRGRCPCGQALCIRNARVGQRIPCPKCGRIIVVPAPVGVASAGAGSEPPRGENGQTTDQPAHGDNAAEAAPAESLWPTIPLFDPEDGGGAGPGVGGRDGVAGAPTEAGLTTTRGDEDVMPRVGATATRHREQEELARQLGSGPAVSSRPTRDACYSPDPETLARMSPAELRRNFLRDLLATFCLNGRSQNLAIIVVTGVACALPDYLGFLPGINLLFWPIRLALWIFALLYFVYFCWRALLETARGEDELARVQEGWDLWSDSLRPALQLIAISFICFGPALYLDLKYEDDELPHKTALFWLLVLGGSFFWPAAVMSVALGETLLFLRPDWLVRCIIGVGRVYVVGWALIVATVVVSWFAGRARSVANEPWMFMLLPALEWALNLYIGYVIFRAIGLMFRHFRHRLPWKF